MIFLTSFGPQNFNQAQHDASEFLVLLWELWGQTGMQGTWHSQFGGRNHDFETLPLFVRMPVEAGDGESLSEWANEANGQCLDGPYCFPHWAVSPV